MTATQIANAELTLRDLREDLAYAQATVGSYRRAPSGLMRKHGLLVWRARVRTLKADVKRLEGRLATARA